MAYRTEVRRFTDTLTQQNQTLGRLLELQKAQQPARVRAGSTRVSMFPVAKETPSKLDGLLAGFAAELLIAHTNGRTSPLMGKLIGEMRKEAKLLDGLQGKILLCLADLGEAVWALPRMWDDKAAPTLGKGYPEFDDNQPRGAGGQWVSGGGGGGGGERRGMSQRRAELFDAYKVKYGYFPPKGMTNQRVEMWVGDKAPAGPNVTHEVRGALAEYRADEPWSTTFHRATSRLLSNVYGWATSPVILDTLITIALYSLATRFAPAVASAEGIKGALNNTLNIVLRRRSATSLELVNAIDGLRSMFAAGARRGRGLFG